jgi:predicted alpha-1,2-mannosidase
MLAVTVCPGSGWSAAPPPRSVWGQPASPHRGTSHPSELVNPLIGTANEGQTFPVAGVPFAMTDWTPQTRDGETKCIAPYYSADTRIQGFRGSHWMSGSCTQDYGSFTLMPESGPVKLAPADRASSFDHAHESARPYRYSVDLADYAIHADITGTARAGIMRFRYGRPGPMRVVLQLNTRPQTTGASIHIDRDRNEVWGENPAYRIYAGSGKPAGFSGYFVAQFDRSIVDSQTWTAGGTDAAPRGVALSFDAAPGTLHVRIGTSFTSVEEARANLAAEIPGFDFDATAAAAEAAWDKALGSIAVGAAPANAANAQPGPAETRTMLYTALYHTMMLPRIAGDVSGRHPRFASDHQTEVGHGFTYYDDFSLWDTFRAVHPLFALLYPERDGEMMQSLIAKGDEGGYLPIFPAWNSYTGEMTGDHAFSVFVDAYRKGVRNFDAAAAYRLMRRNATETPAQDLYEDGRGRRALASYLHYGYVPLEDHVEYAFHKDEQVSRTLDYSYDDALLAEFAAELGHADDAALFGKRAGFWRNVIDPTTGFARGRHADGSWVSPADPVAPQTWVTEGVPIQYTFEVPQDMPGLVKYLGGPNGFEAKLDQLFAAKSYDATNEPSNSLGYLYNFTAAPWKTQQHLRELMDTKYSDQTGGIPGNDDAGQMSAWYVFSAMGFYPVSPGLPEYQIGTPRFDDMTVRLTSGKTIHIVAQGAEAGARYVRAVTWNGRAVTPSERGWVLAHADLIQGGELVFTLSATPGGRLGVEDPEQRSH